MNDNARYQQLIKIGLVLITIGFIGFTLFPYGVLVEQSTLTQFVLNRIFRTELSHFVGHFLIFSIIGTAVLLLFPSLFRSPIFYLSLMFNLAVVQEFLQLATFKRRPINSGELKDLGVDMLAAVSIFLVLYFLNYRKQTVES